MINFKRAFAAWLLASACLGCGKDDEGGGPGGAAGGGNAGGAGSVPDAGDLGSRDVLLDLALNDATSEQAPRGWPLLLMGVAALMEEVTEPIALDPGSVVLRVSDENGGDQAWPLAALTALEPGLALDPSRDQAEVWWALTPEQTSALALGRYTAQLHWADRASLPLPIEIVEPPSDAAARARRAILEVQLALLQGDPPGALELVDAALGEQPNDIALLVWKARAHEADGALGAALFSLETALEQFGLQYPDAAEPPFAILENRRRLSASLLQGAAP